MKKCINKGWLFTKDDSFVYKDRVITDGEKVDLPHTWNGIDGQDGGGDFYRGTCYYYTTVAASEFDGEEAWLEFCAVNSSCDVYVNGLMLKHHDGGFSIFRVNLTDVLEDVNDILVAVDNSQNDTVYPQYADFTFYGGIYRDVNIISVPKSHFELDHFGTPGIKVTPEKKDAGWQVEVVSYITAPEHGQKLITTVCDKEGKTVASAELPVEDEIAILDLGAAHLWQGRKDPYLYTVNVKLTGDGKVLDERTARFGCRTYEIDPDQGFILNGVPTPLRGVAKHQDRPVKGNAISKEDQLEDLQLIAETGSNTIRLAHYEYDQYTYDLCDEMGFAVWAEIPYISSHMPGGRQNTIDQMKELIVQCYNHPSIVVWGLSNEITMKGPDDPDLLENHRILNDLAHEMDPTRPTTMAVISTCPLDRADEYLAIPDVHSWNHYFGWYGGTPDSYGAWFDKYHADHPDMAVGLSEYGCEAFKWHSARPSAGDYTEEYQAVYHEKLIRQIDERPYLWATHVWNMFDFAADSRAEGGENGMNHKGLVNFDRTYKKDSFYAYKAWLSDEPFVHICGKGYVDRIEDETVIKVYTNQPEVELFVNGESVGKQSGKWFFEFTLANVGEQTITAKAGTDMSLSDETVIKKVTEPNMDYVLQNEGCVVLNWFDIDEPEGFYSINDTIGSLSQAEGAKEIVGKIMAGAMAGRHGDSEQAGQKDGDGKKGGDSNPASMMSPEAIAKIMNGFTLKRVLTMAKGMTKEQIIGINKMLNQIPKK